ncbi:MAG TPA: ABC transporter permease [Candidatus Limnocylindrales bacterium]|nr:ABC transporter permease [Candidatus Limnocylindrales bacterium]
MTTRSTAGTVLGSPLWLATRESAGRLAAIASLSAREAFRSRSLVVALVLNLLYLGLLALIGYAIANAPGAQEAADLLGETGARFFLWFALGGASALALFTGVFTSVGSIATEIERGTILAVVARPIARWEIVIGKFLGNALIAVAYLLVEGLAIAAAVGLLSGIWVTVVPLVLLLLSLNVVVMVAVAVAGSTRLSTVANAITVIVLYLALTNTAILQLIGAIVDNEGLRLLADWSRYLLPVGPVSDLATEILLGPAAAMVGGGGGGVPGREVLLPMREWVWLYELGYLGLVIALGVWSFSRRDLR